MNSMITITEPEETTLHNWGWFIFGLILAGVTVYIISIMVPSMKRMIEDKYRKPIVKLGLYRNGKPLLENFKEINKDLKEAKEELKESIKNYKDFHRKI